MSTGSIRHVAVSPLTLIRFHMGNLKPRASDQSNRYIELCIIRSQAGLHRWERQTNESWSKEFITPNRKHQVCLVLALFWFIWKNSLGTSCSGFVWVYTKPEVWETGWNFSLTCCSLSAHRLQDIPKENVLLSNVLVQGVAHHSSQSLQVPLGAIAIEIIKAYYKLWTINSNRHFNWF